MDSRALRIGTANAFKAVPKSYKEIFSRHYLGDARDVAGQTGISEARLIAERVLIAAGMTVGAPVVLPVSIVRGIYKNTKKEMERRRVARGGGNIPAAPVLPSPPQTPLPVGPQDHAANILHTKGLSNEGAKQIAACIYRRKEDWPDLSIADMMKWEALINEIGEAGLLDLIS